MGMYKLKEAIEKWPDLSGKPHWNPARRSDMSGLTGDFGGRLNSIICTSPTHSGILLDSTKFLGLK
jgi:hypothetical protein